MEATTETTTAGVLTDLPVELVALILHRVDFATKHKSVRQVCRLWSEIVPRGISTFGDLVGQKIEDIYEFDYKLRYVKGYASRSSPKVEYDETVQPIDLEWIKASKKDEYLDARRPGDRTNSYTHPMAPLVLEIRDECRYPIPSSSNSNDGDNTTKRVRLVALIHDEDEWADPTPRFDSLPSSICRVNWRVREIPSEAFRAAGSSHDLVGERIQRIYFENTDLPRKLLLQRSNVHIKDFKEPPTTRTRPDWFTIETKYNFLFFCLDCDRLGCFLPLYTVSWL